MGQSNGSAPDQAQALIGSRASKAYGDRCVTLPGLAFTGRRPVDAASLAQRSSEYLAPYDGDVLALHHHLSGRHARLGRRAPLDCDFARGRVPTVTMRASASDFDYDEIPA